DTQDIAKFAVRALEVPETVGQSYPVVGSKAWKAEEIIEVCERLSAKEGKIWRLPMGLLRFMRGITRCFQWTYNISDRLAFAEVLASGQALDASMAEVYQVFGLDPNQTTTLESYLQEYFSRILKKLKEIDFEKQKAQKKKKTPFKKKA
ncbi:MAG: 3-beta hydroxysteroid dehydrogenase, partial [Microcystis sp.]